MADVLSVQPPMSIDVPGDNGRPLPLPNPPFVFPIQQQNLDDNVPDRDSPSKMSNTGSPRSGPRARPQRISLNALPAFDFGAAASSPTRPSRSPSQSPSRQTPPISHSGTGHRRNGSEYVGGDITHGGPMLVSLSPTKSEHAGSHRRNGSEFVGGKTSGIGPIPVGADSVEDKKMPAAQAGTRLGPPPVKRGHAHRRSGAISSHDLSAILKPPVEVKAGSAPTTPSDPIFKNVSQPELDRSASQPILPTTDQESYALTTFERRESADAQQRPRARFSEKIEYHSPRPLSTISSETSSSMSTIRANHSVSDSVSSAVSISASSSPPNVYQMPRRGHALPDLGRDKAKSSPKTAESHSCPSSGSWDYDLTEVQTPTQRPSSAPSRESPAAERSASICVPTPEVSRISKQTSNDLASKPPLTIPPVRHSSAQLSRRRPVSPTMRPRTSPEPKVTKRQRKGRSWAGLLSRKGRQQDLKNDFVSRRSPTPPLRQPSPEMEFALDDINFDEDTTYFIEGPSSDLSRAPKPLTTYDTWKPQESSPLSGMENSSSVLDIDAALDSFDTPSFGPSFEDVTSVGGHSNVKRPMHSSGATGGFAGPGMHYHRRADSAPEMDAVDRSKFGFPRLGSNPAMAIEEEEEEEDEEDEKKHMSGHISAAVQPTQQEEAGNQASGLGVNIVESETLEEQPIQRARKRPIRDRLSQTAHGEELIPVEIVGADEEPRFSMVTKSSDESTITPTISPDRLNALSLPPAEIAMTTPALTFGTSDTTSAISSPDFTRTSFDAPRMHTATSSITDRTTLNSSRAGDHGLGLQGSIDDVPSLTSSASITSAHPARLSIGTNSAADRSSSLSAAVPARTRPASAHKRLSLASLSRLAGSSYNRSKLNIAESAPIDSVERAEKKKGNRISRMMKFWKSKEKLSST